jgi:hypothetical protein
VLKLVDHIKTDEIPICPVSIVLVPNPSAATGLERCAWDCSPESSRQLADALSANTLNVEDVKALGRPVMLAEAIIFDRCLGTI